MINQSIRKLFTCSSSSLHHDLLHKLHMFAFVPDKFVIQGKTECKDISQDQF